AHHTIARVSSHGTYPCAVNETVFDPSAVSESSSTAMNRSFRGATHPSPVLYSTPTTNGACRNPATRVDVVNRSRGDDESACVISIDDAFSTRPRDPSGACSRRRTSKITRPPRAQGASYDLGVDVWIIVGTIASCIAAIGAVGVIAIAWW